MFYFIFNHINCTKGTKQNVFTNSQILNIINVTKNFKIDMYCLVLSYIRLYSFWLASLDTLSDDLKSHLYFQFQFKKFFASFESLFNKELFLHGGTCCNLLEMHYKPVDCRCSVSPRDRRAEPASLWSWRSKDTDVVRMPVYIHQTVSFRPKILKGSLNLQGIC